MISLQGGGPLFSLLFHRGQAGQQLLNSLLKFIIWYALKKDWIRCVWCRIHSDKKWVAAAAKTKLICTRSNSLQAFASTRSLSFVFCSGGKSTTSVIEMITHIFSKYRSLVEKHLREWTRSFVCSGFFSFFLFPTAVNRVERLLLREKITKKHWNTKQVETNDNVTR